MPFCTVSAPDVNGAIYPTISPTGRRFTTCSGLGKRKESGNTSMTPYGARFGYRRAVIQNPAL